MDKLQKALEKLNNKEKPAVKSILQKLFADQLLGLNTQKLRGHTDIFRVRKRNLRIIYQQKKLTISILALERRSEKTYMDY